MASGLPCSDPPVDGGQADRRWRRAARGAMYRPAIPTRIGNHAELSTPPRKIQAINQIALRTDGASWANLPRSWGLHRTSCGRVYLVVVALV